MRYLKPFNESKKFLTDPREIRLQLERIAPIKQGFNEPDLFDRITIHPDGTVDVASSGRVGIILCMQNFVTKLPIRFGQVQGSFQITGCQGLTTLEGSPRECDDFIARYLSKITNLTADFQFHLQTLYAQSFRITLASSVLPRLLARS